MIALALLVAPQTAQDTGPPGPPPIPRQGVTHLACNAVFRGGTVARFQADREFVYDHGQPKDSVTFRSEDRRLDFGGKWAVLSRPGFTGGVEIEPGKWLSVHSPPLSSAATVHRIDLYLAPRPLDRWGPRLNDLSGVAICDVLPAGSDR